ncbi:hypothetical protein ACF09Z_11020 [Streptomyces erythrochromogenes]|uniref:hypothetical protein n=1 Tax=Streptomyces erythrochromogenes TaxID=285574 RepID=UPI003700C019
MTIRTKAAAPRSATARRRTGTGRLHTTALTPPCPAGPAAAVARATAPAVARTGEGTATRVAVGSADRPGAPGATPGAHPACAGGTERAGAAQRAGRAPAGATTPTAGASLPADRGLSTGPEGERTTGEGA